MNKASNGKITDPIFRPVGDTGVMVEFGDCIDDQIHDAVLQLDAVVQQSGIDGIVENIPAYASLLVIYDPLINDFEGLCVALKKCLSHKASNSLETNEWCIPVCYSPAYGQDLRAVASMQNLTVEEVIRQHTSATYKVYMYGFAAGYAYLGGTPQSIQLPRKQAPVNNVPTGSILIAGPQALISTIEMPSGWWIIGRALKTPLQTESPQPFLFNVGDTVRFTSISEDEFTQQQAQRNLET